MSPDLGTMASIASVLVALDLFAISATLVNTRKATTAAENAEQAASTSEEARDEARKAHRRIDKTKARLKVTANSEDD